jgi:predicted rRNA methylase YqxC with S4 and FtsJ domains
MKMAYKAQQVVIKAGLFKDAQNRIEKMLQTELDKGDKNGWKLHSIDNTSFLGQKGVIYILIWEI